MPEKWIPGHGGSVGAIYRGKSPDLTEGVIEQMCTWQALRQGREKSSELQQRTDGG